MKMDFQTIRKIYDDLDVYADPRTQKWAFVNSALPCSLSILCYLAIVYTVPKIMKQKEPVNLKWFIMIYNIGTTVLNVYIFVEILISTTALGYSYACQNLVFSNDPMELRLTSAMWYYFISKIIEMADTVFFILRKKENQVSFLHVYHHSTMVVVTWIGIKWFGGGQSFFSCMANSFVHIIMYTYYAMSAISFLRKYLWWKKYLTQLQLIQFFCIIAQTQYAIHTSCVYPKMLLWAFSLYIFSFIVLFTNFYLKSYTSHDKNSQKGKKSI
ncbi:elongation of very long chain fatty acids protein 4-like [Xenia sp. Carnegie-2017]|uniref:elongation of very long chain fatty acids protein 4-like n=1 Tax=Xenia sp. Carnegie-2017 TaxID=2897299 RepID=UPI001F03FC21|nr:elongation of very long chain fatty acids protein 4-like [Xenia sp. Carnegie-2017]